MTTEDAYILLVEDNEDDIYLTQRALQKQRVANEVKVVRDGEEALDFLFARGQYADREPQLLPQLVLLDINLPKLTGHEVLKAIRDDPRTKYVPVVMLTTSNSERDVLDSYENRVNSYVRKPVESGEFTEAVRQVGAYWLILNQAHRP